MFNKAIERNVLPSQAAAASNTYTSAVHTNTWGRGIRFYVTVTGGANSGGLEAISLCALPPGLAALAANVVALEGFTAAGLLTTNGTFCFDFYPGNWLPASGVVANGALKGAAGVYLPLQWAVQLVFPAGSSATTIQVDAEILP